MATVTLRRSLLWVDIERVAMNVRFGPLADMQTYSLRTTRATYELFSQWVGRSRVIETV